MRPFSLKFILIFIVLLGITPAFAESSKTLKTFSVTPTDAELPPIQALPPTQNPAPILKALNTDKAILPLDNIPEFEHLSFFMALRTNNDITHAKKIITLTPDQIPPLAYYYFSSALAQNNEIESAAFYYYLAELRNEFDKLRFPPYEIKSGYQDQSTTKTKDQLGQPPIKSKRMIDPRAAYNDITTQLGTPVRAWIVKHPEKFEAVLARVKVFDEATRYNYRPPYDLSKAMPVKEWAGLLTAARKDFFQTQNTIAAQLKGVKKPNAPRPFGRP